MDLDSLMDLNWCLHTPSQVSIGWCARGVVCRVLGLRALALIGPESCSATGLVRLARGVGLLGGLGLVWALYVQHLGMTGFSPRYWNALACYEVRCAASEAAAARFGNTSLAVCPCGAKHRTVPPFAHA